MTGLLVQVKNWREGSLSSAGIERIVADVSVAADRLVPGGRYISLLMLVSERAVGSQSQVNDSICRYDGKRLQLVLSETSSERSRCGHECLAPRDGEGASR